MTPRQLILVFCLIIFALLTRMTANAQTHWIAKTGASEPTPTDGTGAYRDTGTHKSPLAYCPTGFAASENLPATASHRAAGCG